MATSTSTSLPLRVAETIVGAVGGPVGARELVGVQQTPAVHAAARACRRRRRRRAPASLVHVVVGRGVRGPRAATPAGCRPVSSRSARSLPPYGLVVRRRAPRPSLARTLTMPAVVACTGSGCRRATRRCSTCPCGRSRILQQAVVAAVGRRDGRPERDQLAVVVEDQRVAVQQAGPVVRPGGLVEVLEVVRDVDPDDVRTVRRHRGDPGSAALEQGAGDDALGAGRRRTRTTGRYGAHGRRSCRRWPRRSPLGAAGWSWCLLGTGLWRRHSPADGGVIDTRRQSSQSARLRGPRRCRRRP